MTTRADVALEARSWLGTPWHHQAMTKGVGADCIGFLAGVALATGLRDARPHQRAVQFRGYGREPMPHLLDEACAEYLDEIAAADAGLADVYRLRVPRGVYSQHFAIVSRVDEAGRPTHILHAVAAGRRAVVEQSIDAALIRRIDRTYRIRGVV